MLLSATVVVYTNMFLVVVFVWCGGNSSVLFDVVAVLLDAEGLFHWHFILCGNRHLALSAVSLWHIAHLSSSFSHTFRRRCVTQTLLQLCDCKRCNMSAWKEEEFTH